MPNMTAPGVRIVSSTKDSIYIQWQRFTDRDLPSARDIRGYKVMYQAIGSSYVQQTKLLNRDVNHYDIIFLHENTFYNICVRSFLNHTNFVDDPGCVRGSTHTDSLGLAIGSTFGAFLALSFIVLLVFLAKRQHTIQTKKQIGGSGPESPELALDEALVHMSDSIYIQLCRQKPDFLERLRDINAETFQLQQQQQQQQNQRQPGEEEQPGPRSSDGRHLEMVYASAGTAPNDVDADTTTTEFVENSDKNLGNVPFEDGLLKPPAIPGVIMHHKCSANARPVAQPLLPPVHIPASEPGPSSSVVSSTGEASKQELSPEN